MAYAAQSLALAGCAGVDVDEDRIDEAVLALLWLTLEVAGFIQAAFRP